MAARRRPDPKEQALREARCLNLNPELVADEQFAGTDFLDARDLVQVKYEMVRRVRIDGHSVTKAAADFGFSRPSFYAAVEALDGGGLPALLPARPGPRRAHKLTDEVVDFIEAALAEEPNRSAGDLAELVAARFGVTVHPRSVERALERRRRPKS